MELDWSTIICIPQKIVKILEKITHRFLSSVLLSCTMDLIFVILLNRKTPELQSNKCDNIRAFHEFEVEIEKFVLRTTLWHHKAWRF